MYMLQIFVAVIMCLYLNAFPIMPYSTEILCDTPSDPFNGKVSLNVQNLTVGAVVVFSCDPGYSLLGNVSITCEQEGVVGMWSNDNPTCDGIS